MDLVWFPFWFSEKTKKTKTTRGIWMDLVWFPYRYSEETKKTKTTRAYGWTW